VLAAVLGVLVPNAGRHLEPMVTPLVTFLIYGSLRGFEPEKILSAPYAFLVVLSLIISYIVLPAGGMQIVRMVVSGEALVGFSIILSVPTTAGSAIIWTRLSQGDDQLATSISMISLFLAPIATPLIFSHLVGSEVIIPFKSLLLELLVIIFGGWLLSIIIPDSTVSSDTIDSVSSVIIMVLIYVGIARVDIATLQISRFASYVFVSILLLSLVLLLLALSQRVLQIGTAQAISLFFTSGLKNLGVALLLGISYSDSIVTVPIIVYYVVQQLIGAVFADQIG